MLWATRKHKRLRGHRRRAAYWLERIAREKSGLFAHWRLLWGRGLGWESRMSREAHVRFCERLEGRFLRATRLIVSFEQEAEARRSWSATRERLEHFGLELHGEKTRLLEFGRYAAGRRQRPGHGRPETFRFLDFTFICGRKRAGGFQLQRRSRSDRMRAKLAQIKTSLKRHMHAPVSEQGRWLACVLRGYFAYHAVPTNLRSSKHNGFLAIERPKEALGLASFSG